MTHNCSACGDPATHRLYVPRGVDCALTKRIARILGAEVGDRVCMRCFCNALTMIQIENEGITERIEVAL